MKRIALECRVQSGSFYFSALAVVVAAAVAFTAAGADLSAIRRIPNEYESAGGHTHGLGHAGVASVGGVSAVRTNPGLLPLEPQYSVTGGYNWPTDGRDFYQFGVVDTTTSAVAAGVTYTSFTEKYRTPTEHDTSTSEYDSPVNRRLVISLAQKFSKFAIGVQGEYVEGFLPVADEKGGMKKGLGLGMGIGGLLTPFIRFGVAAENIANRKIEDYAPRVVRSGVAWLMDGDSTVFSLDYKVRDRVGIFEGEEAVVRGAKREHLGEFLMQNQAELNSDTEAKLAGPEHMVTAGAAVKVYNAFRLLGSYSHCMTDDRRSISGGAALVSEAVSMSYAASRPYLAIPGAYQSIVMTVSVQM